MDKLSRSIRLRLAFFYKHSSLLIGVIVALTGLGLGRNAAAATGPSVRYFCGGEHGSLQQSQLSLSRDG